MNVCLVRFIFVCAILFTPALVRGQTVQSVLRALQERKIVLEWKESYTNATKTEIKPIIWGEGATAITSLYPQDTEEISLVDTITVLNQASRVFDDIKEKFIAYDVTRDRFVNLQGHAVYGALNGSSYFKTAPIDLPSVGAFDADNWRSKLKLLVSCINQLRCLEWPVMVQFGTVEFGSGDNDSLSWGVDFPGLSVPYDYPQERASVRLPELLSTIDNAYSVVQWMVDGYGYIFFPPPTAEDESPKPITHSNVDYGMAGVVGLKTTLGPARELTTPVGIPYLAGRIELFKSGVVMDGGDLTERYVQANPPGADPGSGLQLATITKLRSAVTSERTLGAYQETEDIKEISRTAFVDGALNWLQLNRPVVSGSLSLTEAVLSEENVEWYVFSLGQDGTKQRYIYEDRSRHALNVALTTVAIPDFTQIPLTYHEPVEEIVPGTVEPSVRDFEMIRVNVGRGSDGYQTGWLCPRVDCFGSLRFRGSPNAFELLYEEDYTKFTDTPVGGATFDSPQDFTADQKSGSSWQNRFTYITEWFSPRLKQVKGRDLLVTIDYPTSYQKVLNFYWAANAVKLDNGFFQPGGRLIKSVFISNPTAANAGALPNYPAQLFVSDNNERYYNCWFTGVSMVNGVPDLFENPRPTAVFTFTCDNTLDGAFWKQVIRIPDIDWMGEGGWQVCATTGENTINSLTSWRTYHSPLYTYEPRLWASDVENGSQTVNCVWSPAPDNRNEVLTQISFAGSTDWPANGRMITWNGNGWKTTRKELIAGFEHKIVENISGNVRTRALSFKGSGYRDEKVVDSADLKKETLSINGEVVGEFTYSDDGELALAEYPGGYRESFTWASSDNVLDFVHKGGWGAQFASGVTSIVQSGMIGDVRKHIVTTAEGVTLRKDEGTNFTEWGAPRTMKHLRGNPSTLYYEELGLNWGLPLTEVDGAGVSTGVTGHDWLSRITGFNNSFETITAEYEDPLKPKFTKSGGSFFQSTYSSTGLLKAVEGDDGVAGQFRLGTEGESFIKDYENRSVPLNVDAFGVLRSIGTGGGTRGEAFNFGVDQVAGLGYMLYTETVPLTKTGTASAAKFRTYYDARGRVRVRTGPDANGNPRTEEWIYNDSARSVMYKPGAGPVAQSSKRTLSEDGQTLTISRNSVDLIRYERQAIDSTLVQIASRYGPAFGSGEDWEEVSREVIDPAAGSTSYTPWGLETQKVTVSSDPPARLSKVTINGPSGLNLQVPLSQGQATGIQGTLNGVPVNLSPTYTLGRLTALKGQIDAKDAGLTMKPDGRLLSLWSPLSSKGFHYGSGPNFSVTVTDTIQGTTGSFTADAAGDMTGISRPGMPTLSLSTTDTTVKRDTILKVPGAPASVTLTSNHFGLLTGKIYNGGITESYAHTSDGSLDAVTTSGPDGSISIDITPTSSGSTTSFSGSSIVEEDYPSGLRKSISGLGDGRSFTYQRDALRKEIHTAGPWNGWSVERLPDADGRFGTLLISQGTSQLQQFSFGYDANSRLASTSSSKLSATYSPRKSTGEPQSLTRGDIVTSWGYDAKSRLAGLTHKRLASNVLSYDFSDRDAQHRIRSRIASVGRSWTGLVYDDPAGHLQRADVGGRTLSYNHDVRGNRYGQSTAVANSVNGLDQIYARVLNERGFGINGRATPGTSVQVFQGTQQLNGLTVNPASGEFSGVWSVGAGDGGLISTIVRGTLPGAGVNGRDAVAEEEMYFAIPPANESIPADTAGRPKEDAFWRYEWDGLSRLSKMTRREGTFRHPDITGEVLEFRYDSDGRRTEKTHTLTFSDNRTQVEGSKVLWSGWLPVLEERSRDSQILGRRWFQWGEDVSGSLEGAAGIGGLVAIIDERTSQPTRTLLPLQDGLGNVTAVLDASNGAIVARYDYGPFGEPLGEYGEADACPFRFQTKWYDAESEYYYFGYRYYSSRLGRWLTRDPLGEDGGVNLYAYCGNDPVNRHDPTGLNWVEGPVVKRHWYVAGHGSLYLTQRERYWVEEENTPEQLLLSLLSGMEAGMGQWGNDRMSEIAALGPLIEELRSNPASVLNQLGISSVDDVGGLLKQSVAGLGQLATDVVTDPFTQTYDLLQRSRAIYQQAKVDWDQRPNYAMYHAGMASGPTVARAIVSYVLKKTARKAGAFPVLTRSQAQTRLIQSLGPNPYGRYGQAHHIFDFVDHNSPLGHRLRGWGIDLNSAENGVWLPTKANLDLFAAIHSGKSTTNYRSYVQIMLGTAKSPDEASGILRFLKNELQSGFLKINDATGQ